jgi:hypothetical protein
LFDFRHFKFDCQRNGLKNGVIGLADGSGSDAGRKAFQAKID